MDLRKILVVDDNDDVRDALTTWLELQGYSVLEANGGNKAYSVVQAQEKEIQLVITDVRMPDGDGVELLKKIKSAHPSMPVVVLTGYADHTPEQFMGMGAAALLEKPFNFQLLQDLINKVIKK